MWFFGFALAFSFIAVTWPKMANRPNKQPKETRIYRKYVRSMEDSKTKTLSSIRWLSVRAHNIFLLLFLFRIAFTTRAVTSSKIANNSKKKIGCTCVAIPYLNSGKLKWCWNPFRPFFFFAALVSCSAKIMGV